MQVDVYSPIKDLNPPPDINNAGWDIRSAMHLEIRKGEISVIPTGIHIGLPRGLAAYVLPRSSLASKGLTIVNAPGLIDPGYTGEVKVIMTNLTDTPYQVILGERIAQIVFHEVSPVKLVEVSEDNFFNNIPAWKTRRDGALGSTGRF